MLKICLRITLSISKKPPQDHKACISRVLTGLEDRDTTIFSICSALRRSCLNHSYCKCLFQKRDFRTIGGSIVITQCWLSSNDAATMNQALHKSPIGDFWDAGSSRHNGPFLCMLSIARVCLSTPTVKKDRVKVSLCWGNLWTATLPWLLISQALVLDMTGLRHVSPSDTSTSTIHPIPLCLGRRNHPKHCQLQLHVCVILLAWGLHLYKLIMLYRDQAYNHDQSVQHFGCSVTIILLDFMKGSILQSKTFREQGFSQIGCPNLLGNLNWVSKLLTSQSI